MMLALPSLFVAVDIDAAALDGVAEVVDVDDADADADDADDDAASDDVVVDIVDVVGVVGIVCVVWYCFVFCFADVAAVAAVRC